MLSHGQYGHFGGMVGFLNANRGKLKDKMPFFVGGEDWFKRRLGEIRHVIWLPN